MSIKLSSEAGLALMNLCILLQERHSLGPFTIRLHAHGCIAIVVTVVITMNPGDSATLLTESRWDVKVETIRLLQWDGPSVWIDHLKAIVWLPHPYNVARLRISPDMMSPKVEVVELHVLPQVLHMELLATHVFSGLCPVSPCRVVMIMHSFARISTDTLLHSSIEAVDDPHVTPNVTHNGGNVPHPTERRDWHMNLVVVENRGLLLNVIVPRGLLLTVAEGSRGIITREELEAEGIGLATDEDLVVTRIRNGEILWLDWTMYRLWVHIGGVCDWRTWRKVNIAVFVTPSDTTDTLAEPTAWVVVLVTPPVAVPAMWTTLPCLAVGFMSCHALWLTVIRAKVFWVQGVGYLLRIFLLIVAPGTGVLLLCSGTDGGRGLTGVLLADWSICCTQIWEKRDLVHHHGESVHSFLGLRDVMNEPHDSLVTVSIAAHSLKLRRCGGLLGLLRPGRFQGVQREVPQTTIVLLLLINLIQSRMTESEDDFLEVLKVLGSPLSTGFVLKVWVGFLDVLVEDGRHSVMAISAILGARNRIFGTVEVELREIQCLGRRDDRNQGNEHYR